MAYLVGKTSIDIISDDAVDIRENLPVGFYFKLESAPMRGFYLEKTDYNTAHGKIYGKSDMIASHVADAYEKSNRSLGVLFSGGKGLGKSLTTRLVIEKLINNHAVIINILTVCLSFLSRLKTRFIFLMNLRRQCVAM